MSSRETDALIRYMAQTGVPHRVTSVNEGSHTPGSRHYRMGTGGVGLAVDFAGPQPSWDSPQLRAIFDAFVPAERQLHELIYADAPYNIKGGVRVRPYAVDSHHNHVHVSVDREVIIQPPTPPQPEDPRNVNVNKPPVRIMTHPIWGNGYTVVTADGGVFTFGGAPFHGSAGDLQLVAPIVDAQPTQTGGGYYLIASDGGVFAFGDADYAGRVIYAGS